MRIKQSTSFPHPVLSASTGDYRDRIFQVELEVFESAGAGDVRLAGRMALNDPVILALVESGKASAGLMVTCQDTYVDRFEKCSIPDIDLRLPGGLLRGTVHVQGVVIATEDNLCLESDRIDAEFPPESRVVAQGDFIAVSEELNFEAGLEKLAPLESVFRLKRSESTPEGRFELGFDSEAIEIFAPPLLYDVLYNLRQTAMKDLLLSAIYLPVVMSALDAMRDGEYVDRRWCTVITSRCNSEQIDIKRGDLATSAQKLLDGPLGSLKTVIDKVG